ncbi:MAG TPA: TIGR03435 family protein [Vicinamibacterales bacterium]|nr:TIGR03435 family protein [Vicinamibacterales bacterium]
MKPALTLLAVVTLSGAVFAQTAPNAVKFAAADLSLRARTGTTNQPTMTGGVLRGGRYDLRNATMLDLIATAYSVGDTDLITGGPAWLERQRFDIAAKAPQDTTPANIKLMLQDLLADRFKLVIRRETRPTSGFVLQVGKEKHKLKEATGPGAGCQGTPQPQPPPVPMTIGACKGVTMDQFAVLLRQIAGGYINAPVQNQTGLPGYWDFDVAFTPFQALQRAGADAVTIFAMIERQLGLKLEQGSAPAEVFVVDRVNPEPTPNPSGVSAAIPLPPPMEFDVAVIKLSPPEVTQPRTRLLPGGRIEGDGITMNQIMQLGWDITTDELVVNTPKWWNETRYSILAQTSTAVSGVGQDTNVDIDDLKAMLRQLVTERFQLKSHYEERPVTAYTLMANGPKMTKADPANRTGFREGPAPGQRDQRNQIINRMVTVRNMSMPQFAEDLRRIAGGYIRVPIEDQTGLDGSYDFTLAFTAIGLLNARGGGPGGGGNPAGDASDPTGGLSLFDAVDRQLGLKLEMRKRPMRVLVIDSIQEKPID